MKFIIKLHSVVDLITNSSSEIFMTVHGEKEVIENVIEEVLHEMGCEAVEFSVSEYWDDDKDEEVKNKYEISYDYECHQAPCTMMEKKIRERLEDIFGKSDD